MKFKANQSDLLKTLNITGKAIGTNIIMPILECCLLNIKDDKLEVTGSNLEVFISHVLDVESDGDISIAVPHGKLSNLVRGLPVGIPINFELVEYTVDVPKVENGKAVTIKEKRQRLDIITGSGKYTLPVEDGEDYPQMVTDAEVEFKLDSQLLLECLNKTLFAVGSDQLKPVMTGVNIEVANKKATLTATNSHILSTFNMNVGTDKKGMYIVPAKVLSVLKDMPVDKEVKLAIGKNNIVLEIGNDTTIKSTLIDGIYIDYKAVIPTANSNILTISREDIKNALSRIVLFSNQITNMVKLELGTELKISSENTDYGEQGSEVLAADYEGDQLTIGFNGKMLLECIKRHKSDSLQLELSTPNRAAVIKDLNSDFKTDLMLIMPSVIQ